MSGAASRMPTIPNTMPPATSATNDRRTGPSIGVAGRAMPTVQPVSAERLQAEYAGVTEPSVLPPPQYRHPKKNWRLKRGAMPQWYKQRHGIRGKAQSGAARVARFRPPRHNA